MARLAPEEIQDGWEIYKTDIQTLYQVTKLEDLMEEMAKRGFRATRQQYRSHFKTWGIEKYISSKQRKYIDRKLSKRDKANKQTKILRDGHVVPMDYVRKQLKRHCKPTLASKFHQQSPSPQTSDNEWGLTFRTPSLSPVPQLTWSFNNPWLYFQKTVYQYFTNNINMPVFPQEIVSRIADAFEAPNEHRIASLEMANMSIAPFLSEIHSALGRFLPDTDKPYQTTTANTIGKVETRRKQFLLEAMFYGIINHHIRSYDNYENEIIEALLYNLVLLQPFLSYLRKSNSHSSEVLLDSLFSSSIRLNNSEAVELLLRTGADPYKRLLFPMFKELLGYNGVLPIQAAILYNSLDVTDFLHRNGAKLPKTEKEIDACGWHESPVQMLKRDLSQFPQTAVYLTLHYTAILEELVQLLRYHAEKHDAMEMLNLLQKNPANAKPEVVLSALLISTHTLKTSLGHASFTDEPSTSEFTPEIDYSSNVDHSVLQTKTLHIIKRVKEHGANLDRSEIYGVPSLHLATQLGLSIVVKGLLDLGLKPCLDSAADYQTEERFHGRPLHIALRENNFELASLLIEAGSKVDGPSVYVALSMGMEDDLKRCTSFDRGSDKTLTPVSAAFLHSSPTFPYQQLMKDPNEYDAALLMAMVYSSTKNRKRDLSLIKILLGRRRQFTRNTCCLYEGSALSIAAQEGDEEMVNLLLQFGISYISASLCFRHLCLKPDVIRKNLGSQELNRKCAEETLTSIAFWNSSRTMKILLDNGFLPSKDTVENAFILEDKSVADVLVQYLISGIPNTYMKTRHQDCLDLCLIFACDNHETLVPKILLGKADLTATWNGDTALAMAVQGENKDIVKLLLKNGADVKHPSVLRWTSSTDILEILIDQQEAGNKTWALVAAAKLGSVEIVEMLISSGIDINSPVVILGHEEDEEDEGHNTEATALQMAAMRGYNLIAKLLLDHGADPNFRGIGHNGRTALEGAAENGRLDMVSLLLRSKTLIEGQGQRQYLRAVQFATRECHSAVERLLRDHREWTDDDELLFNQEDLLKCECAETCSKCWKNSSYDDRLTDSDSTDEMDGMDSMDDMDDMDDTDGIDDHDSPGIANIEDTEMDMGPIQMASDESHLLEPTEPGPAEGRLLVSNYNLPVGESRGDFVSWNEFDAGLTHPSLQFAPRNWETFDVDADADFDAYFDFDAYYNDAGPNLGGFTSPGR